MSEAVLHVWLLCDKSCIFSGGRFAVGYDMQSLVALLSLSVTHAAVFTG